MMKYFFILSTVFVFGIVSYYLMSPRILNSPPTENSIICFGDSITEGYRLPRKHSYPYQLGLLLGEDIINEGISGETSPHALKRLQRDVLDRKPRLVIVQFGGNDPYHEIPYDVTLANNDLIVEKVLESGAKAVLLIGEYNMLQSPYLEGFREIAQRRRIILIDDAISDIVENQDLRLDDVHPNVQGYKIMARHIAQAIQSLL